MSKGYPLNEKEYRKFLVSLESLKEICSDILVGSKELKERLITDLKESLKKLFFFIRLMVTKDFESSTGMSFDKWIEFAEKLSKQFGEISNAVQKIHDCYLKSQLERISESIDELEHTASPFLENYDYTLQSIGKLQKWLAETPNKVKSAPPGFIRDEEKREMIEGSSKAVADLQKFTEALVEAKIKILTIKDFIK